MGKTASNETDRRDFSGLDLSGRDFSGADLSGADFRLSRLNGIKLEDAELSGARFFLSSGLTAEQRRYLKEGGAKALFFFSPGKIVLLLAIPLLLAFLLFHTTTSIHYISVPALQEKIVLAKARKQYSRALQYNQELLKRHSQNAFPGGIFNASLDAAKIHSKLDRREEALDQLKILYADSNLNLDQKARVRNDLARFYLEKGETDAALNYLDEIDRLTLRKETLYMVGMSRALILRRQRDFTGALSIYRSLLQKMKIHPPYIKKIQTQIRITENKIK